MSKYIKTIISAGAHQPIPDRHFDRVVAGQVAPTLRSEAPPHYRAVWKDGEIVGYQALTEAERWAMKQAERGHNQAVTGAAVARVTGYHRLMQDCADNDMQGGYSLGEAVPHVVAVRPMSGGLGAFELILGALFVLFGLICGAIVLLSMFWRPV